MQRRSFLVRAVAAVAGVFGLAQLKPELKLRKVWKFVRRGDAWLPKRVRMFALRAGDIFVLDDCPESIFKAQTDGSLRDDGQGAIEALCNPKALLDNMCEQAALNAAAAFIRAMPRT